MESLERMFHFGWKEVNRRESQKQCRMWMKRLREENANSVYGYGYWNPALPWNDGGLYPYSSLGTQYAYPPWMI